MVQAFRQPEKPFEQCKQRKRQQHRPKHLRHAIHLKRQRYHAVIRRDAVSLGELRVFADNAQFKFIRRKGRELPAYAKLIALRVRLAYQRFVAFPRAQALGKNLTVFALHQDFKYWADGIAARVVLGRQQLEAPVQRQHQLCGKLGGKVEQGEHGGGDKRVWGHFQAAFGKAIEV